MGIFRRKKENLDFEHKTGLITAFDRIEYFIFEKRDDEKLFQLSDRILAGSPIIAKLEQLSIEDCNYVLSFVSGVVYALNGRSIKMGERLFLFARGEEFEDGSLNNYVEDNR